MYTVIRHYTVTSGSVDTLLTRVDRDFLPIVQKIKGFVAYIGIKERHDRLATVSVFETQAGCNESTRAATKWRRENPMEGSTAEPDVIMGEVVVHAGLPEPAGHHAR